MSAADTRPSHWIHVRNTIVMIVLAILAAATWVATWTRQPSEPAAAASDAPPLGYYLRGTRLLGTDEQGRVIYRLDAERVDELPGEARLRLEGVALEYRPAGDTAWGISAATASTPKDGSLLDLVGNVEVRSAPSDGSDPMKITTQKLRFRPDTSSVQSDEPVEIRIGDWQLKGIGLSTDLKGHTLKLESQVHGTFRPQ